MFKVLIVIVLIICFLLMLPKSNECEAKGQAGFFYGLIHGFFSPLTWFISLFTSKIDFYQVANNGGWYNFGFVLGAGILFGGKKSK